jgi:tetratricopeptide (TPR) repeat protein
MKIEPDDDLNIYTYACSLYYVGQLDKSLEYFTTIINKYKHEFPYGVHGVGFRFAKQLKNDSVYMSGVVCQDMHRYNEAKNYFMRYLERKKPFQYSDFTKKQAMTHLLELKNK